MAKKHDFVLLIPLVVLAMTTIGYGTTDCNNNGIDDAVDISGGYSNDCNGNGIPDECYSNSVPCPLLPCDSQLNDCTVDLVVVFDTSGSMDTNDRGEEIYKKIVFDPGTDSVLETLQDYGVNLNVEVLKIVNYGGDWSGVDWDGNVLSRYGRYIPEMEEIDLLSGGNGLDWNTENWGAATAVIAEYKNRPDLVSDTNLWKPGALHAIAVVTDEGPFRGGNEDNVWHVEHNDWYDENIVRVAASVAKSNDVVVFPILLSNTQNQHGIESFAQSLAQNSAPGSIVLDGESSNFVMNMVNAILATQPCENDCNNNGILDSCDIAENNANDCNHNRVPDLCDVQSGNSLDCNNNNIPDECEFDCNNDGIPDECQLQGNDCDGNGFPDNCQVESWIDVVFLLDSSGSQDNEIATLCSSMNDIVDTLTGKNINIRFSLAGVILDPSCSADIPRWNVVTGLGYTVPGNPEACYSTVDVKNSKSWGPASSIIASRYPWIPNAQRLIIPISDEGPCRGGGNMDTGNYTCGSDDQSSITNAIAVCNQNNVIVSPIIGTGATCCVIELASSIAKATGGHYAQTYDFESEIEGVITGLIESANIAVDCNTNEQLDICEIANDPTLDCQSIEGNGILDICEDDLDGDLTADTCQIIVDPTLDCPGGTGNGILDLYENDCNENNIADSCDIETSISTDDDANGIPDECEYIIFVDHTATTGNNDGTSWDNAYLTLSEAIKRQPCSISIAKEIWVARGTYVPGNTASDSFVLQSGLSIYGGFTGIETQRSQRDSNPLTNGTILSGDIDGNDGNGISDFDEAWDCMEENGSLSSSCSAFDQKSLYNGTISSLSDQWIRAEDLGMYGNSLQVIKTADTDATAILDGFTITRSRDGGIVLSEDATIRNCAVTQNFDHGITVGPNSDSIFTNCLIHDNYGEISGVGLHISSKPTFENCTISNNTLVNTSVKGAGALIVINNSSDVAVFENCTFSGNIAKGKSVEGGGIYIDLFSSHTPRIELVGCQFLNNVITSNNVYTTDNGSASGGAICVYSSDTTKSMPPKLVNCIFKGNRAEAIGCNPRADGGGIYSINTDLALSGLLFEGNAATDFGGAIFAIAKSSGYISEITNCTFVNNTANDNGGGLCFVDYTGAIRNSIFWDNNALNGGTELFLYSFNSSASIQAWKSCVQNYTGVGVASDPANIIDLSNGSNIDVNPNFVSPTSTGDYSNLRLALGSACIDSGDNTYSNDAELTLDLAGNDRIIDGNGDGVPTVDMGAYEYLMSDCNGNGIPDTCDLDCTLSGCSTFTTCSELPDCNLNGVPDECDISAGESNDCNRDGIPDECGEDCNGNGIDDTCECHPADVNNDGYINGLDMGVITNPSNWSTADPANPLADVNCDGIVNGIDIGVITNPANWGKRTGPCESRTECWPDTCSMSVWEDSDGNGIVDAFECHFADVDCSGTVGAGDILVIQNSANWGMPVDSAANPRADVDGSGVVGAGDILTIQNTANWGATSGPCICE